jgi:hypothetical protein
MLLKGGCNASIRSGVPGTPVLAANFTCWAWFISRSFAHRAGTLAGLVTGLPLALALTL